MQLREKLRALANTHAFTGTTTRELKYARIYARIYVCIYGSTQTRTQIRAQVRAHANTQAFTLPTKSGR